MLTIARTQRKKIKPLNLTPLIDVIFLLIVFFMLTSKFALDRVLDLSLAPISSTEASDAIPGHTILILLEENGRFQLWAEDGSKSEKAIFISALKNTITPLIKDRRNHPIVIVSNEHTAVQDAINALEYLRQAGATNVQLASSGGL